MSRMVVVKEVTMTDLAERAVRQQIKRMKQKDRKR